MSSTTSILAEELPAIGEGTMLQATSETGTTSTGMLSNAQSELSLVVRESLSSAAEQGLEEAVEKLQS